MKIPIALFLCIMEPSLLAQNKSVELTVVRPDTSVQSSFKSHFCWRSCQMVKSLNPHGQIGSSSTRGQFLSSFEANKEC